MSIKYGTNNISKILYGASPVNIWWGNTQVWSSAPAPLPDYLCFTANTANSTIAMNMTGTIPKVPSLEYSSDGRTWTTFTPGTTTITLSTVGSKAYMRGTNEYIGYSNSNYCTFVMTGSIAASGNIMSLINGTSMGTTLTHTYIFRSLFQGCTALTSAPSLPATTLTMACYYQMFQGCTGLTAAPALPATTLASYCYTNMFYSCSSLTTPPALPATTLASYCYYQMFARTALTWIPKLNATVLPDYCYRSMFINSGIYCANTQGATLYKYAFRIPTTGTGTSIGTAATQYMFQNTTTSGFTNDPALNTTYYINVPIQ